VVKIGIVAATIELMYGRIVLTAGSSPAAIVLLSRYSLPFVLLRNLDGWEPLFIDDYADRDRLTANLTVFNIILLSYGAVDEELNRLIAIRTRAVDRFHTKRRHTPPQRHYTPNAANKATPTPDSHGMGRLNEEARPSFFYH
jgi:hypothetical protein